MPRTLDHLVLPVGDLAVARQRLMRLGFTVAADARHPFGTRNACVFFADKTYLEPLAIADRDACEAAAASGNAFVARDLVRRARCGDDGFSAVALTTQDAFADDAAFSAQGVSGGAPLEFARAMRLPDGREGIGRFRLAFAASPRAPDFFLFTCQRIDPLPADRASLECHPNGALGLREVVLCAGTPAAFAAFLDAVVGHGDRVESREALTIGLGEVDLTVLTPDAMTARFGAVHEPTGQGLRAAAVVVRIENLAAAEAVLSASNIAFERAAGRLAVPAAPGQGTLFLFETQDAPVRATAVP